MMNSFYEKQASRSNPRFGYFIDARELYNGYVNGNGISFDEITRLQQMEAAASPIIQKSEELFTQATLLAAREGASQDAATGLYQLGILSYMQGRYADADILFQQGLKIFQSLPDSPSASISNTWFFLGLNFMKQGDQHKARFYLEQAVDIDTRTKDFRNLQYSQKVLQKCETDPVETVDHIPDDRPSIFDRNPFLKNILGEMPAVEAKANAPTTPSADGDSTYTVNDGHSEVIWVFSHSVKAASDFMDSIEGLAGRTHARVSLIPAAFEEYAGRKYVPPVLERDERLCAVVFLLEKEGVPETNTRIWLDWCIQTVIQREDFRLFVILVDMTQEDLERYTVENSLPDSLQDTVQLIPSPESIQACDVLTRYLLELDEIRRGAAGRQVGSSTATFAGWMSGVVQVVCSILLGITILVRLFLGESGVISWLGNYDLGLVTVIAAIPFFSMTLIPLHLLLLGPMQSSIAINGNKRLRWWLLPSILLASAAIGLPMVLNAPISWILLGILLGSFLEITRRNGAQNRRTRLSLHRAFEMSRSHESSQLAEVMIGSDWNPWNYPLTTAAASSVFISYTRRSEWSKSIAARLEKSLRARNIRTFRDESSIESGSSWRNQLDRNINDCNILVSILDDFAVQREWVASEMLLALTSQSMTGLPAIFVLGHPQFSNGGMLPVFSTLYDLQETANEKNKVRFVSVDEDTIETFASGLASYSRSTPSILPSRLTSLFYALLLPLQWIGPFGLLPGLLCLPVAYFQFRGWFDLEGILLSRNILVPCMFIFGYWIGYMFRLSFASSFEIRHPNTKMLAYLHLTSGTGFLLMIIHWWEQSLPLLVGWSLALGWLGWTMAGELIQRSKPDLAKGGEK